MVMQRIFFLHSVSMDYLDWLTRLPFGAHSEERLDLEVTSEILDEDHYGMDDVKKRILGQWRGGAQMHQIGLLTFLSSPPHRP